MHVVFPYSPFLTQITILSPAESSFIVFPPFDVSFDQCSFLAFRKITVLLS